MFSVLNSCLIRVLILQESMAILSKVMTLLTQFQMNISMARLSLSLISELFCTHPCKQTRERYITRQQPSRLFHPCSRYHPLKLHKIVLCKVIRVHLIILKKM